MISTLLTGGLITDGEAGFLKTLILQILMWPQHLLLWKPLLAEVGVLPQPPFWPGGSDGR